MDRHSARIVVIIQARMGSSRLPGKVLREVGGKSLLEWMVERLKYLRLADEVGIATGLSPADDPIEEFCQENDVPCFRGSDDDVLDRFLKAARTFRADAVVRLTADCPLIDPEVVDRVIGAWKQGACDYASNVLTRTWPRGMDTEVLGVDVLERVHREATSKPAREHVTTYIRNEHPEKFQLKNVEQAVDQSEWEITVDTPEDLDFVRMIVIHFSQTRTLPTSNEIVSWLSTVPEDRIANRRIVRKTDHLEDF